MLLPESSCVCIPSFRIVAYWVFLSKYHFSLFFSPGGGVSLRFSPNSPQTTPQLPPSTLENLSLAGQTIWEEIENIHTVRHTEVKLHFIVKFFQTALNWCKTASPPQSSYQLLQYTPAQCDEDPVRSRRTITDLFPSNTILIQYTL